MMMLLRWEVKKQKLRIYDAKIRNVKVWVYLLLVFVLPRSMQYLPD